MARAKHWWIVALAGTTLGCSALNPAYDGDEHGDQGSTSLDQTATTTIGSTTLVSGTSQGTADGSGTAIAGASTSAGTTVDATATTEGPTTGDPTTEGPATEGSSGDPPAPRVLLVNQLGDLSLPLDVTLAGALESAGMVVVPVEDDLVVPEDADDVDVVVISETATATSVTGKLRDVARPVVVLEGGVWDPMDMAPYVSGSDAILFFIEDPAHPLAAGLSGQVTVMTEGLASGIFGTEPPPTAHVIARAVDGTGLPVAFTFEAGQTMDVGFVAPARRVGLGYDVDRTGFSTGDLTVDGTAMFVAAVQWALQ